MGIEIIISALAAVATAIAGFTAQILARREREKSALEKQEAENIADAVAKEGELRRARALEALAEKLPASRNVGELEHTLEALSLRLQRESLATPDNEEDVSWSVVEDLVQSYHRQALDQAKVQFWFSVVAATVGFALILYMVLSAETTSTLDLLLRALPGAVIDAVAALFFRQAGETRERATALYDRLRTDNQRTQALAVVTSIENETIRSTVQAQIALHMAGIPSISAELAPLLPANSHAKSPGAA
jgi:hypothetical protein